MAKDGIDIINASRQNTTRHWFQPSVTPMCVHSIKASSAADAACRTEAWCRIPKL
jgi:hypothetical protein